MANFSGYSKEAKIALNQRANKILQERMNHSGLRCNLGGCSNHSGHEYCSISEAWENAVDQAKDELCSEGDEHA